jgi:hypothetical protein
MTAAMFGVLCVSESPAGKKTTAWKEILPDDVYKELTKRSIAFIETTAKTGDKDLADRIEVEAAILAAFTMSVKDPAADGPSMMRGAALQASKAARAGDLDKLKNFGATVGKAPKAPAQIKDFTVYLQATEPMMKTFLGKGKKGDGIHPDLQYQVKLKNLNGIEALVSTLAGKKLTDENVAKLSKELPFVAYRLAAAGSITHEFTPKKDVDKWRDLSATMRDQAVALAEAASKKNGANILKAATALDNTCIECHSAFKNK